MATLTFNQYFGYNPEVTGSGYGTRLVLNHNYVSASQAISQAEIGDPSGVLAVHAKQRSPITVTSEFYSLQWTNTVSGEQANLSVTLLNSLGHTVTDLGSTSEILGITTDSETGDDTINYGGAATQINLANVFTVDTSASDVAGPVPATADYYGGKYGSYFDIFPGSGNAYVNKGAQANTVTQKSMNGQKMVTPIFFDEVRSYSPMTYELSNTAQISEVTNFNSNTVFGVARAYEFVSTRPVPVISANNLSQTITLHLFNNLDDSRDLLVDMVATGRKQLYKDINPVYSKFNRKKNVTIGVLQGAEFAGSAVPVIDTLASQSNFGGVIPTNNEIDVATSNFQKTATKEDINNLLKANETLQKNEQNNTKIEVISTSDDVLTVANSSIQPNNSTLTSTSNNAATDNTNAVLNSTSNKVINTLGNTKEANVKFEVPPSRLEDIDADVAKAEADQILSGVKKTMNNINSDLNTKVEVK